jgi:hypothetical protein
MYADMTLPGAEANPAMKRDLQMTKADRNALRLENACVPPRRPCAGEPSPLTRLCFPHPRTALSSGSSSTPPTRRTATSASCATAAFSKLALRLHGP